MNRTAVESSNVAAVGYDLAESTLEVQFHSGGVYRYKGVEPQMHLMFLEADSKGSFVNRYIKGKYPSERVEADTEAATQPGKPLSAMQQMYLDMIRASSREQMDGPLVVDSLLAHRDLWEAAVLGSSFGLGLVLRDLADGYNNVDTLYILCDGSQASDALVKLAYQEWDADDVHLQTVIDRDERLYDANVNMCLGGRRRVVAVWWD